MGLLDNVLTLVISIASSIAIIVLVIYLIKDIVSFVKGEGTSLLKILGKVGAVVLIIAIMFLATSLDDTGEKISGSLDSAIDQGITDIGNEISNGGSGGSGGTIPD